MTVFRTILTKLTLSWIINEIYVNILIFVYGWTHNAPRIPKMYNITGIWWIRQKLLTVKPIATLRQVKWNYMKLYEMKNDRRGDERYMTKVIYQKTTEGEMKDIWRKSYIKKRRKGRWKIYDESHISMKWKTTER